MAESAKKQIDESVFRTKTSQAINRMLNCLLTKYRKPCKGCSDVNACSLLTEAVYVYRTQLMKEYRPTV